MPAASVQVVYRVQCRSPLGQARDMIKLLARSVPLPQAKKVLEDEAWVVVSHSFTVWGAGTPFSFLGNFFHHQVYCDIMKIGGLELQNHRFLVNG